MKCFVASTKKISFSGFLRFSMASVLASIITSKTSQVKHLPKPFIIKTAQEISIGRGAKCDIAYADVKAISNVHCLVRNLENHVQIKDVSSNRTILDGKPLVKNEWFPLKDGSQVVLSHDPRVKFEVRIGSDILTTKKRKATFKPLPGSIAYITSSLRPEFQYSVVPDHSHAREVAVTVGRAKDCDVRVDDKKVSSVHCKFIFRRVEGESVHWSLEIESVSKNKTFVEDMLVDSENRTESFMEPLKIALVFPLKDKPVEVLTIEPVLEELSEPSAGLTAADLIQQELEKEEKRKRKELHHLEKQSKEWQTRYKQDIESLQEKEHSILLEIESLNKQISIKQVDTKKLRGTVDSIESDMNESELRFKRELEFLKEEHERKLADYTSQVNGVTSKLQKMGDEKIRIQMGLSNH
jgi:pSer/pThr/pTyr-binding forkhead associated (FHA) protein